MNNLDSPNQGLCRILDYGDLGNKPSVVLRETDTGLLSCPGYDDLSKLAPLEIEELSSKLIADFYSANNRCKKLQKLKEPSLDDSVQLQATMNVMDVLWKDIKMVKKVSKTNLFSYSPLSAKAQVKIPSVLKILQPEEQKGQLKLCDGSGATCRCRGTTKFLQWAREGLRNIPAVLNTNPIDEANFTNVASNKNDQNHH